MDINSPLIAIPLFAALLFLIVGSPTVYAFTDSTLAAPLGTSFSDGGAPTRIGLIVHAGVTFLAVYAYLKAYAGSGETTSLY